MARIISAIAITAVLVLLTGCESCQQDRIQRAEREGAYSSPRTISWNPWGWREGGDE
jgi:hypothetical protein